MSVCTPGPASGGRARSVRSFRSAVTVAAVPAASVAQSAARGSHCRLVASPIAPATVTKGHFTHQAEAIRNTAVSGPQWISWVNSIAALSHWAS
jgi:hypothetical protein